MIPENQSSFLKRKPVAMLTFDLIREPDSITLIAGEDQRYRICSEGLDEWFPETFRKIDGLSTVSELIEELPDTRKKTALQLLERLYGERILVDSTPESMGVNCSRDEEIEIFSQDTLDYSQALEFNKQCMRESRKWIWTSTGARSRFYVSPVFLPDSGPCMNCLFMHFKNLSPVSDLYSKLSGSERVSGQLQVDASKWAMDILNGIVQAKIESLNSGVMNPAIFRFHVLELDTLAVSSHKLIPDVNCGHCSNIRLGHKNAH